MSKLNEGVAVAALSIAVIETFKIYQNTAPSLAELRRSVPGDYVMRQLVLDADMLGVIFVLAIGGGGTWLTGKPFPILLSGMALVMISAYYRSVLASTNEGMRVSVIA